MKKHTLTLKGFKAFQDELLQFDDASLLLEAIAAAEDSRAYIAERFEVDVLEFEIIRRMEEGSARRLGWNLALWMVSREPLTATTDTLAGTFTARSDFTKLHLVLNGTFKAITNLPETMG
jgi:hypothetical protein